MDSLTPLCRSGPSPQNLLSWAAVSQLSSSRNDKTVAREERKHEVSSQVPRISVVLCTYNGAPFIGCQLESLASQTRLPDEVIVSDDKSSDETLSIVTNFQRKAPFAVGIHVNDVRLGAAQNFGHAVGLASGDIIALCDQDDQWLPTKLAEAEKRLVANAEVEAVFSDGFVVNSVLEPMGYTLWQHTGISGLEKRRIIQGHGLEVLIKHVAVTGATLTVRSSLLRRTLPIPEGWMHDAWFSLMAAAAGTLGAIPTPLILYRQHGANEIGARRVSLIERWRDTMRLDREAYYRGEIGRYQVAKQRLEEYRRVVHPDAIKAINAKLRHLESRASLPASRGRRIVPILREFARLGYWRYSFGWQVAVKDFLLPAKVT